MFCTYQGNRDEALLGHLYDEGDQAERAAFDAHLAGCSACCAELTELAGVRAQLAAWTPAEPARPFTYEDAAKGRAAGTGVGGARRRSNLGPGGGRTAVRRHRCRRRESRRALRSQRALGAHGLDRIADRGHRPAPATPVVVPAPVESDAWRAELTTLEQRLRAEFRAATTASSRPAAVQTRGAGRRGDPPPRPDARRAEREPAAA